MDERASYRFALRPWWIASHLLVVFLVVLFVNLGFWQLRRLDERKEFNAAVEANAQVATEPLPPDLTQEEAGDLEWRRVTAEGRYRSGGDVLVANRSQDAQPGYWLVSLLERDDGPPVAVMRGFAAARATRSAGVRRGLRAGVPRRGAVREGPR
jgi:surfeit locus 1 family protein